MLDLASNEFAFDVTGIKRIHPEIKTIFAVKTRPPIFIPARKNLPLLGVKIAQKEDMHPLCEHFSSR